eukprot:9749807-Ditylum_brightwellii.AAC.1
MIGFQENSKSGMDSTFKATTAEFTYEYTNHNKEKKHLQWEILVYTDYIQDNDKINLPKNYEPEIQKHIDWNNINNAFLTTAEFHRTVQAEKIYFHQPDAYDPDWCVKRCYTLIVAAASEVETGVDNLWRVGLSLGCHNYPDFGKYIPKNAFKAFCSAAPYAWSDKKYWYEDKRDKS